MTLKFYLGPTCNVQAVFAGHVVACNGGLYHVLDSHVFVGSCLTAALTHEHEIVGPEADVVLGCVRESGL